MPARAMAWNDAEDTAHDLAARLQAGKTISPVDVEKLKELAEWTTYTRETMELVRTMAQTGARSVSSRQHMTRLLARSRWTFSQLSQRRET